MQRKHQTHIQIETRFTREYFLVEEGSLAENVQNHPFINSLSLSCIQYIFNSRGAVFLMRYKYLKQDSNIILKQFLFFLTFKFWKKVTK